MSNKSFYFAIMTGFSAAAWLYYKCRKEHVPVTVKVKIDKDKDGVWRILDKFNQNKGTLEVRRGDTVKWLTKKSDVEFTFPKGVDDYFRTEQSFFKDDQTQRIAKRKSLQLVIKKTAPLGKLKYKVHVVDADKDVVGHSPPVMIIRR